MVAAFPIGFIARVCRALVLLEKTDSGLRALPATAQVGGAPKGGGRLSVLGSVLR
jgi:hypothetical protein